MPAATDPWDEAEDEDRISLGRETASSVDLGPDERDRDLIDGSWEADYYAGRTRSIDWQTVGIGVGLLLLIALILPAVLVFTN
jgi:hypothetical protein